MTTMEIGAAKQIRRECRSTTLNKQHTPLDRSIGCAGGRTLWTFDNAGQSSGRPRDAAGIGAPATGHRPRSPCFPPSVRPRPWAAQRTCCGAYRRLSRRPDSVPASSSAATQPAFRGRASYADGSLLCGPSGKARDAGRDDRGAITTGPSAARPRPVDAERVRTSPSASRPERERRRPHPGGCPAPGGTHFRRRGAMR
jgi:hypothetical protein